MALEKLHNYDFVSAIRLDPLQLHVASKYGMASKLLVHYPLKLLANLYSTTGKTKSDRIITALTKIAPAA